ncbi:uncharacterized protein LAESUDRAFT_552532 [Laetiporus sulphureus 93-53]|uniref:Uncharacterized protein n=1 Tax=Laetiporus sulphureus 93-53 TaxID=1314785 RepID=A0A165FTT8_9APHY|nr:uncharacterized protein LAESUDRAFT_552532 [Laetiporus sulphureus 93-53]KZT09403.1 hypothetical protein LAESUDRAFT_552532 [Laetiporus sulphureus 93-53]
MRPSWRRRSFVAMNRSLSDTLLFPCFVLRHVKHSDEINRIGRPASDTCGYRPPHCDQMGINFTSSVNCAMKIAALCDVIAIFCWGSIASSTASCHQDCVVNRRTFLQSVQPVGIRISNHSRPLWNSRSLMMDHTLADHSVEYRSGRNLLGVSQDTNIIKRGAPHLAV